MSHDIQVLLRLVLILQVDIRIYNPFNTRIQRLDKLLSKRRENHRKPTSTILGIVKPLDVCLFEVLRRQDLARQNDKAGAFHGNNVGKGFAAVGRDVVGPLV